MSSELELLRQHISELETKNANLEAEKAEIEARNVELLKQVMEENAKRDARVEELEQSLEIEMAKKQVEIESYMLSNGMLYGQEKEIVKYNIQKIAENVVPWWEARDAWNFI
ncbi:hypothetical protein C1645_831456 [Glomus cerebriforme]|uniref:Uncharacterized protein n=1 Tax=Glomus cerebriforme TaxID=658196 RepID=A0A397SQQ6_9GLOM|nr:hypothetical protein C1645_831456 [Glomus cerebriforme]